MILPTIHMNGTSKKELKEQLLNAYRKLREARNALQQTSPHGRDYYPQGEKAFSEARREHCSRLNRLNGLIGELEELAIAIDQLGERE